MQILKNNVMGVLSGSVDAFANTIPLVSLSGWPVLGVGEYCLATLIGLNENGSEASWEIVKVTGRSGSSLTVERGQEDIPAKAWAAGTVLQMRLTAASIATPSTALMQGAAGSGIDKVKTPQSLGKMAFMDVVGSLVVSNNRPDGIGCIWFERASDSSIKLFFRGNDGISRSAVLMLEQ